MIVMKMDYELSFAVTGDGKPALRKIVAFATFRFGGDGVRFGRSLELQRTRLNGRCVGCS